MTAEELRKTNADVREILSDVERGVSNVTHFTEGIRALRGTVDVATKVFEHALSPALVNVDLGSRGLQGGDVPHSRSVRSKGGKEMSDERCCSGSGGVLLAFLAGGLVGAGLALLYAPVSGREARERIGGLAEDLKKKTEEWTGDVKQKVEGFIDEERSVIKSAYEAGREAMAREKARFENPNPE